MYITKKHLSRRTFLRGAGVAVGLPLLDAMIPSLTALAQTAAAPKPRLGFLYLPHGAIMEQWTPATEGAGFEMPPILKLLTLGTEPKAVATPLGEIRVTWPPIVSPIRAAIRLPTSAVPGSARASTEPARMLSAMALRRCRSAGSTPRTRAPAAAPFAEAITCPSM